MSTQGTPFPDHNDSRNYPPPPAPGPLPGQRQDTADAAQDFSTEYQTNSGIDVDMADNWKSNRKRTYDVYQHAELEAIRQNQRVYEQAAATLQAQLAAINNVSLQALQNSVKVSDKMHIDAANDVVSERASSRKIADMAADGMWTDQMDPVTRGAGADLTGQAPVNAALASTASIMDAFGNITTQVVGLAQTIMQSNVAITNTNASMVALLAQMVQNAKQNSSAPAPTAAH